MPLSWHWQVVSVGLAAIFLMIMLGRIAGISGIVFSAVKTPVKNVWSVFFVVGLVLGAFLFHFPVSLSYFTFLFHFASGNPPPVFEVPLPPLDRSTVGASATSDKAHARDCGK